MKKFYFLIFSVCLFAGMNAQDLIYVYDGTNSNPSTTLNASQDISVSFEDTDITNNFYTENQNSIYAYICYKTSSADFQGCVGDFNDVTGTMLEVSLDSSDGDPATASNLYTFTFNPQTYLSIANGIEVTGLDIIFVNQFAGGGNNQTVDLSADLADITLSTSNINREERVALKALNNQVQFSDSGSYDIRVYDISGKQVVARDGVQITNGQVYDLGIGDRGVYIVQVRSDKGLQTVKTIVQ